MLVRGHRAATGRRRGLLLHDPSSMKDHDRRRSPCPRAGRSARHSVPAGRRSDPRGSQDRPADRRPPGGARRPAPRAACSGSSTRSAARACPPTSGPPRRRPGSPRCCASGARAAGSPWSTTARSGYVVYVPAALAPGASVLPTAPVSPDALLMTTAYVLPEHRGGGLGRMLVQGMARDLHRARRRPGDRGLRRHPRRPRRPRVPAAVRAAGRLPRRRGLQDPARPRHDAAAADGPRSALTWRDEVELALEQLRGVVRPARQPARPVSRGARRDADASRDRLGCQAARRSHSGRLVDELARAP